LSGGGDAISLSEASLPDDSGDTASETTSEKNVSVDADVIDRSIEDCKARRCRQEEILHHSLWSR
jgi:hypothetical protein